MSEDISNESRGGFASDVVGLEKSEESDTITIDHLSLLYIVGEQELGL